MIEQTDFHTAKPFIERWHYSGVVPKGKNLFFSWTIDREIYAISNYGIGVNPYQVSFLNREVNRNVTKDNLLELKRLCRSEPKKNVYLTHFLSRCHKILKAQGYRFIVSFSDPEYGHNGGIYKAANFKHIGVTQSEYHVVDKSGTKRHRRYAYRHAKRNNISIAESREILGLTISKTKPKDRWFLKI